MTDTAETAVSIERRYFPHAKLAEASAYIEAIHAEYPAVANQTIYNFDPENPEFSETTGLLVIPQTERIKGSSSDDNKTIFSKLYVCSVPEFSTIIAEAPSFVENILTRVFADRVLSSQRLNKLGEVTASLPVTVKDYTERRSTAIDMTTFNILATPLLKVLAKKNINLQKPVLKQCLSNAAMAATISPKTDQSIWEDLLKRMVTVAESNNYDAAVFTHWLETRNYGTAVELEITSGDLDSLFSKPEEPATVTTNPSE